MSVDVQPGRLIEVRGKPAMRSLEAYLFATREQPIIGISRGTDTAGPAIAPADVRAAVGPAPRIYFIPGDYLLRRLGYTLGRDLALPAGAARIWWPGLSTRSDPQDHPLVMALDDESEQGLGEEFARSFDLSQPRVRREIRLLVGALALAEHNLTRARAQIVESTQAHRGAPPVHRPGRDVRGDPGDRAHIHAASTEESLHMLIAEAWIEAFTAEDRRAHPLRYVLSPAFVTLVEGQPDLPRKRIAWVCAMVACGYAPALTGLNPHQLLTGAQGSPQLSREDGAKGWRCNVKRNAAGGPRMHYWIGEDGTVEFAALGQHDSLGRR